MMKKWLWVIVICTVFLYGYNPSPNQECLHIYSNECESRKIQDSDTAGLDNTINSRVNRGGDS